MNQWYHLSVERNRNSWNTKGRKKHGGCDVSGWQGRAEARGGEWEWSKAARHHISFFLFFCFCFTHSTTPPGTVFFRLGNAGPPEAANRSLNHRERRRQICREGVFVAPEYMREENLDSLPRAEEKETTSTPVLLCFMLGFLCK